MTIRYSDGRSVEALLLSRAGNTIRAAMEGTDDVTEFANINGAWVSDDCDLVTIEFAWQRHDRRQTTSEADCNCSRELAAWLIQSLFTGSREDETKADASNESPRISACLQLPV